MKNVNVERSEMDGDAAPESDGELDTVDGAGQAEESLEQVEAEMDAAEQAATRIEDELRALQEERGHLANQLLRARADFDNYRKRMAREAERTRQVAAESLIRDILPVLDHLELALKHAGDHPGALGEGVSMVLRQFQEALGKHGVQPIPAAGEPFDPNVHEAVMQQESESMPPGVVVVEFQKGYRLGQMVLRPAKVVVSVGHAPSVPSGEENVDEPPADPGSGNEGQT